MNEVIDNAIDFIFEVIKGKKIKNKRSTINKLVMSKIGNEDDICA